MARSYSMDLRMRVMADVDSGHSIEAVGRKYSISSRAIFQWRDLLEETGSLEPHQGKRGPKRKLEPHREAILVVVEKNSSVTLEELKTQLDLPGCVQTLWNSLRRWGVVLKKSHASSGTATT
jgi:transposase